MKKILVAGVILLGMSQAAFSMEMGSGSSSKQKSPQERRFNGPASICWESCYKGDDDKAALLCIEDCELCYQLTAKAMNNCGALCANWNARKNK